MQSLLHLLSRTLYYGFCYLAFTIEVIKVLWMYVNHYGNNSYTVWILHWRKLYNLNKKKREGERETFDLSLRVYARLRTCLNWKVHLKTRSMNTRLIVCHYTRDNSALMLAHIIQTNCQNVLYRMRATTCSERWVNWEQETAHGFKKV